MDGGGREGWTEVSGSVDSQTPLFHEVEPVPPQTPCWPAPAVQECHGLSSYVPHWIGTQRMHVFFFLPIYSSIHQFTINHLSCTRNAAVARAVPICHGCSLHTTNHAWSILSCSLRPSMQLHYIFFSNNTSLFIRLLLQKENTAKATTQKKKQSVLPTERTFT